MGTSNELVSPTRPARALIGWMTEKEARLCLTGRRQNLTPSASQLEHYVRAVENVAARPPGVAQDGAITALSSSLDNFVDAFRTSNVAADFFNSGFELRLVDLTRICAIQRTVHADHAAERVQQVDADDLASIAAVTLPLPAAAHIPVAYDASKNTWVFSSPNPNLRVKGQFAGEVRPGVHGFGFAVGFAPSFVQVAKYAGRLLLRDGYHRAVGLIARGITHVPAFYKEFRTVGDMELPAGLIPHEVYLGNRPPLLTDYGNDDVSAEVETVIAQKTVIVQALEIQSIL
ncbi:MAG: hypothetical protein V4550_10115 [Gemmatimonadota bacterium]